MGIMSDLEEIIALRPRCRKVQQLGVHIYTPPPPITTDCVRACASFLLRGVDSPQALFPLIPAFPADHLLPVAIPLMTRTERSRAGAMRVKLSLPLSLICSSQQILVLSPSVDLCLSTAHDPPHPARPIWLAVLADTVFLQRCMLEH